MGERCNDNKRCFLDYSYAMTLPIQISPNLPLWCKHGLIYRHTGKNIHCLKSLATLKGHNLEIFTLVVLKRPDSCIFVVAFTFATSGLFNEKLSSCVNDKGEKQ
jgi:hypothetical protein